MSPVRFETLPSVKKLAEGGGGTARFSSNQKLISTKTQKSQKTKNIQCNGPGQDPIVFHGSVSLPPATISHSPISSSPVVSAVHAVSTISVETSPIIPSPVSTLPVLSTALPGATPSAAPISAVTMSAAPFSAVTLSAASIPVVTPSAAFVPSISCETSSVPFIRSDQPIATSPEPEEHFRPGPYDYLSHILSPPDRIRRVNDEMTFRCILTQGSVKSTNVPCIVDTGCGGAYLLVPTGTSTAFATTPFQSEALLADGTVSRISLCVRLVITILSVTRNVTLKVLESSVDAQVSVLFGRELLAIFGIDTESGCRVKLGRHLLYDSEDLDVYADDIIRRVLDEAPPAGLVDLPPPHPASADRVVLPVDSSVEESIERLLTSLVDAPPQPLPRCEGTMCLRRVRPNEQLDTPEQKFVFELDLDQSRVQKFTHGFPTRLYAQNMFNRLSPAHRVEVNSLIDDYVKNGWWTKATRSDCKGPPANVFGVCQKQKLRLVCDLRNYNEGFPSTTLDQPFIPFSLSLLRLVPGNVVIGDCRSAFYRVHLVHPLWVHCGDYGDFLCSRMTFGLSMGPEGLQQSLGVLWRLFSRWVPNGCGSLFVDDFWIHSPTVSSDCARFLSLIGKCGFDVPQRKFQQLGSERNPSSVSVLGVNISYQANTSTLSCERSRLQSGVAILDLPNPTKAQLFGLAGLLAYDPGKSHTAAKVCGDLLRSVSGKVSCEWNVPLDFSQFDPVEAQLYTAAMAWARELIASDSTCSHSVPVLDGSSPLLLRLMTDASHCGGAYVLQFRPSDSDSWTTVYTDAWFWKRAESTYHCNRLEAVCLFRGLSMLSRFIEFFLSSQFGIRKPHCVVSAYTDSSTSLAWALSGSSSQGFESRHIGRLCDGLHQEILHLRKLCSFSLQHISGDANFEADALSRILERPAGTETLGSLLRKRQKSAAPAKVPDTVRRLADESLPLAEVVAADSYDVPQAIYKFALLRFVLRTWSLLRGVGEGTLATTPTLPEGGSDQDFQQFCRSFQSGPTPASEFLTNPFRRSPAGIIEHVRVDFNGEVVVTSFVPKRAIATQRLIVRTYHRLCYHRGASFTGNFIKLFWLEARTAAVQSVIKCCFRCAVKNARVQWSLTTNTFPRQLELAPFSRMCIDHLHMEKVIVVSVMCIDTGVLALLATPNNSTSIDDSIVALRRLFNRYSLSVRLIHCDQASSFTSPKFAASLSQLGQSQVEISLTTPGSPYTNPVERLHREVLSIVRSEKFLRKCVLDPTRTQDSLDEIASIVNQRPLGRHNDDEILTPAKLAWGGYATSTRLPELRKYFYEHCFNDLRRVGTVNRQQRRGSIMVGQFALLYSPASSKLTAPFQLCKITDIQSSYMIVRTSDGISKKVGSNQLAPLDPRIPLDSSPPSPYDVSRIGARVASSFVDVTHSNEPTEFLGDVVAEYSDLVEVAWLPTAGRTWHNELVPWGACRVYQVMHSGQDSHLA